MSSFSAITCLQMGHGVFPENVNAIMSNRREAIFDPKFDGKIGSNGSGTERVQIVASQCREF